MLISEIIAELETIINRTDFVVSREDGYGYLDRIYVEGDICILNSISETVSNQNLISTEAVLYELQRVLREHGDLEVFIGNSEEVLPNVYEHVSLVEASFTDIFAGDMNNLFCVF